MKTTIKTYVCTDDKCFYYKTISNLPCYGTIPIYIENNQPYTILVTKPKTMHSFPKGRIESNEHPLECAMRETFEETQLEAGKDYTWLYTNRTLCDVKDGNIITQYFPVLCKHKKEVMPIKGDCIEYAKWLSFEDIFKLDRSLFHINRKRILTNVQSILKLHNFIP